jgi:UDP-N-acetylglucosamine 2-epimerase (non-hydrolysing)
MHLNPNVRKLIREIFGEEAVSDTLGGETNIFFIEPLEYLRFVYLTEQSTPVLTDSGGIREEAPAPGGNARHNRAPRSS